MQTRSIVEVTKHLTDVYASDLNEDGDNYILAIGALVGGQIVLSSTEDPLYDFGDFVTEVAPGLIALNNASFGTIPELGSLFSRHRHLISSVDEVDGEEVQCYFTLIPARRQKRDVIAIAFTSRASSANLLPWNLRRFSYELAFELRLLSGVQSFQTVTAAYAVRDLETALAQTAALTTSDCAILWTYDFDEQVYEFHASHGPISQPGLYVPLGGNNREGRIEGIVGQARPEQPLVTWELGSPGRSMPKIPDWHPHDPEILQRYGFRACVAWPIVTDGELLGAFSIYSRSLEELRFDRATLEQASYSAGEYLRARSDDLELFRMEDGYQKELARASSGAIASEFIHDFKRNLELVNDSLQNLAQLIRNRPEGEQRQFESAIQSTRFLKQLTTSLEILSRGGQRSGKCDAAKVILDNRSLLERVVWVENRRAVLSLETSVQESRRSDTSSQEQSTLVGISEFALLRTVINLVRNAGYWTRTAEEPVVTIRLRPGLVDRRGVTLQPLVLSVVDNGTGISPTDIGQVFSRGFTRRREHGGSGLGLHIVRQLLAEVGGEVKVWSHPGRSTTFQVLLAVSGGSHGS